MTFVELQRYFVPIERDQEPILNITMLGPKFGGWLDWSQLLEHRRVVLLAEALSGKSEEFRNQQRTLSAQGKAAFFVCIEELAEQGFEAALFPDCAEAFEKWYTGSEHAYFFLDSIDEARLNRKSFETAIKRFAREIDSAIERAAIFISCRVTDWKTENDRRLLESILPWRELTDEPKTGANLLLDPIFEDKVRHRPHRSDKPRTKPGELLVVQLVPLSGHQCRKIASHLGVEDPDAFMAGINQGGLDAFTERPGDVIDLATYWKAQGRFAALAEMTEHNISRKLAEIDAYRPDNDTLTQEEAWEGAERVAAALSLGKTLTLQAPGLEPDPCLAAGALDPQQILPNWSDAKRNALLRRGVFAPSTYGRIRFHHRSTQEYLTAKWLDRLLQENCPRDEIWNLIFAERYGIKTLVPSLKPAAAWLALRNPDIRDEIVRREPLALIRHGDPGSLSLDVKKRLLLAYASKHADADIADDSLDHRALWLFSEPALSDAIRKAWQMNERDDFRVVLLRMIREGNIAECRDLAREAALDESATEYDLRIIAAQALLACDDGTGLKTIAKHLMDRRGVTPRIAAGFAKALFPKHLSVPDLLLLIDAQPGCRGVAGFPYALEELYEQCEDAQTRKAFVSGLADLCLSKPHIEKWHRISRRHVELTRHLGEIARREILTLEGLGAPEHVVQLLMVLERCERSASGDGEPPLGQLVHQNTELQHALFWADVADIRHNGEKRDRRPTRHGEIYLHGPTLWRLGPTCLPCFFKDLANRYHPDDKRIALSAIVTILQRESRLDGELPAIRKLIKGHPALEDDLTKYLAPAPAEEEQDRKRREHMEARDNQHDQAREAAKASWVKYRAYLRRNFDQLRDPELLKSWEASANRLYDLTKWLERRTDHLSGEAPLHWRLLEEGFGRDIAEAYRDGMKMIWRVTKPERPQREDGGGCTIKRTSILAFWGVSVEAAEDSGWTIRLTADEAKTAALHGCLTEQGYPEWLDSLTTAYPKELLPIVRRTLKREWEAKRPGRSDFLYRYSRSGTTLHPSLSATLFNIISGPEPEELSKLDTGIRIIARMNPTTAQKRAIMQTFRTRFHTHRQNGQTERALRCLALLLTLDCDKALEDLTEWLSEPSSKERRARSDATFAYLFDRHDPIAPNLLGHASTATLGRLLRLAYHHVHRKDDQKHESSFRPNTRDHAESARDTILSALVDRPGFEAYDVLRRTAFEPDFALSKQRFRELTRYKAEHDSELPRWTEREAVSFAQQHAAPVKTGSDLLGVAMSVLRDIQFQLDKGDVSSRRLLQRANDENEVRNWIMEQMNFRSCGRFHAYREAHVADRNRPDIIVASTAAHCEVGIEVKHGGKPWTYSQLQRALRIQLAKKYLQPVNRRHGVLVITNHGGRRWRDTATKKLINFSELLSHLVTTATQTTQNDAGAIQVRCFGIDVAAKADDRDD